MGKIISIAGMGGAGKTTFAVNLSCALADKAKVVTILSAEMNYGALQTFFGEVIEPGRGTLESLSDKTEQPEKLLTQCNKVNENIYLMSIPNENYEVHMDGIEENKLEQIIRRLSIISDYLIIDCTPDLYSGITVMGIEKSDYVFCLYKSTANGLLWNRAVMPIILQLTEGKTMSIISEHQLGCDPKVFAKMADISVNSYLPNVAVAPIMENVGKPLFFQKDKKLVRYKSAIAEIADGIINGKEEIELAGE